MTRVKWLRILALGLASCTTGQGQSALILEGFESGIDSVEVFTDYGGRSADGLVHIAPYTAIGQNDPHVTEGAHSVAVTIGAPGFGNDLRITLPESASEVIQAAVAASDGGANEARYILRYDLILPNPGRYVFFNHLAFVGNSWDYGIGASSSPGGVVTVSVPLDVNALNLPSSGPIAWIIANSFSTVQPFSSPVTIYLDNIRLVDTYAPGVITPQTYLLQSFEDAADPLGGAASFTGWDGGNPVVRALFSSYTANDPDDIRVSEGSHSLQVNNSNPGFFHADFTLPLAGTRLAEVLKLDAPAAERPAPSDLAFYTLRWDVVFPDADNGVYVNQLYHTGSAYLPMAQGRQQFGGPTTDQRLTYSVTLDQIAAWGGLDINPGLICINDGPPTGPSVYYYDHFRLIHTAPSPPEVTGYQFNPLDRQFTVTWTSLPGAMYAVQISPGLTPPDFTPAALDIPSGGAETTATVTMPAANAGYLRIQQQ